MTLIIPSSKVSQRTRNPIREIVDNLKVVPNPSKKLISLALGDPTTHGNFVPPSSVIESVQSQLLSGKANGYLPSVGLKEARQAIAHFYTTQEAPLTENDIVLASGCSDALNLCIGVLCNEGQNILLPAPGFSLYETLASSKGIECLFYHLVPERQWEADLSHMESLIDSNTAAILINNPSNPCGSVYSKEHLRAILAIAERHQLPIISDEIYADMAFEGNTFYPLATLTNTVPILTTGGLAKRYLVPGWRVGWVLIHDRNGAFQQIRKGLVSLTQLILGPNSLIQSAIPQILKGPKSFYAETMSQLQQNARISASILQTIPGLVPILPQGAMYLMLQIKLDAFQPGAFKNDRDFVEKLVQEESVLCLPGECFRCPGAFIRIVITPPKDQLEEAYLRIKSFCERYQN